MSLFSWMGGSREPAAAASAKDASAASSSSVGGVASSASRELLGHPTFSEKMKDQRAAQVMGAIRG
jgi:hypothetical protein